MCGRYQLIVDANQIQAHYSFIDNEFLIEPREEVYPSQKCPIITTEHTLIKANWGFDVDYSKKLIINARAETILEKDLFANNFEFHRCLIPASAFFEWKDKIKHRIEVSDRDVFVMAGVMNFTEGKPNFVVVTKAANQDMASIHDRMPVIFSDQEAYDYLHASRVMARKMLLSSDPSLSIHSEARAQMLTLF